MQGSGSQGKECFQRRWINSQRGQHTEGWKWTTAVSNVESSRDFTRANEEWAGKRSGQGEVSTDNSDATCSVSGTVTEATHQDWAGGEHQVHRGVPSGRLNCIVLRYVDQSGQITIVSFL